MKIEDCKTLPEFFGVKEGDFIWIDGVRYEIYESFIIGINKSSQKDGQPLVGCLTGQLEWSKTKPKPEMTADEEKLLREIAVWEPGWASLHIGNMQTIQVEDSYEIRIAFKKSSKAYEVLAPILEKYGEINLDEYREDEQ